ncbi:MAG: TonB-dependent vitamin B12 receptor [Wenzhouxiangellaceae bacterium]
MQRLLIGGMIVLASNSLSAQVELEPTVVTATRQNQSLDDTLAAVTLIDRAQIERSQAQDMSELLRTVPGIDLVRSGPRGTQTSLFMRGTNSNQVLVLIDGVRVSEAANGLFTWEHLALAQIERIEIVRGPRAAYYGSDAVGGVIQIFTRRGQGIDLTVGGGSFSTRRGSLSLGGSRGAVDGRLTLSHDQSEGFSAQNENGFSFDPDNDGYRNFSLTAGGGYDFGGGRLSLSLYHSDAEADFDAGVSDNLQQNIALQLVLDQGGRWRHQARAGFVHNQLDTANAFGGSEVETQRWDFSWLSGYRLSDSLEAQLGADFYTVDGEASGSFDESRDNLGVYTGLSWNHRNHDIAASIRLDDDNRFGSEFSGQLAWGWRISQAWRFSASYGRSFRAPNFNQLFSPGFGGLFAGNPELEPETGDSFEFGLRYRQDDHQADVRWFQNDLNELIDFSGVDFQAVNVQEARARGVEISYQWTPRNWRIDAQATLQDTENRMTGAELLRRPDHKASVVIERQLGSGHWLGGEMIYIGERDDFGGITLDEYFLLNLRGRLQLTPQWRLQARVENLLDEAYQPAQGFNGQGRSVFIELGWSGQL